MADNIKYYVVKQKALPEVLLKVAETNRIIETENISVADATEKVGISRSSITSIRMIFSHFMLVRKDVVSHS